MPPLPLLLLDPALRVGAARATSKALIAIIADKHATNAMTIGLDFLTNMILNFWVKYKRKTRCTNRVLLPTEHEAPHSVHLRSAFQQFESASL